MSNNEHVDVEEANVGDVLMSGQYRRTYIIAKMHFPRMSILEMRTVINEWFHPFSQWMPVMLTYESHEFDRFTVVNKDEYGQ